MTVRSVLDFEKTEVLEAIRGQRARTLALLEPLSVEQWEIEVTPGWRTREVAAHLITTDEGALTGRMLAVGLRPQPDGGISAIEDWNNKQVSRWADRPIPSLLKGLERWGRRLERTLRMTPGRVSRRPIPTPFGKVSLHWLAMLRVYDEWVHGEDVRRALGVPPDDHPEAVRAPARQLLAGVPFQTLPRLFGGTRGRAAIRFSDLDLPALGVDLGARRFGFGIPADATIVAPAATLIMIAARRDRWDAAERERRLSVEGDRPAAEALLDALCLV
jgi:uncharacterized protein (TIGR03083 family)